MSYVQRNGLPLSPSTLGALTPTELNAADKAFKKAVPAGAWDFLKTFPFLTQSMKNSLVDKPVTTMLGTVSANRNLWIKVVNRAAILQGKYNKVWVFPSIPNSTRFAKVRATTHTQDIGILKMWLALSWADPISCIRAVVIEGFKVASGAVNWYAAQIAQALGLSAPSVGGLGEPLSASGAAVIVAAINVTGAVVTAAITAIGAATATITVAVLDKAYPDANTEVEREPRIEEARAKKAEAEARKAQAEADKARYSGGGSSVQPVPPPGGGSSTQSAEDGGVPSWVLPVGIGAGMGIFLLTRKKRS